MNELNENMNELVYCSDSNVFLRIVDLEITVNFMVVINIKKYYTWPLDSSLKTNKVAYVIVILALATIFLSLQKFSMCQIAGVANASI